MPYTLACRDAGVDCDFVSRGETKEQVLVEGITHVKKAHGFTDKQVKDPKFIAETKKLIKKT
jgi:predicted small metal-binding protein